MFDPATPTLHYLRICTGAAFAMADIVTFVFTHSVLSILDTIHHSLINAGLAMDIVNFIWVTVLFGVIYVLHRKLHD